MLDERGLRRSDFLPGTPIRLADGQFWTFPTPPAASRAADFDGRYAALLLGLWEAEDEAERYRAELALAIFLLNRNYGLQPAGFHELLGGDSGEAALECLRRSLHGVAADHARRPPSWRPAWEPPARRPLPAVLGIFRRLGFRPHTGPMN